MRKILCSFIIMSVITSMIFPVRSFADSPVTSTDFYTAYLDIEEVAKASEMTYIDEETALYLSDSENPIDVKAAVINAIGWEKKDNAERYSDYIFGKPLNELDLDTISDHDLFCIGYLMVMDNHHEIEAALSILEKASLAMPDSFTVAMITAIAKAQVVFSNADEWYKVWEFVNEVIQNKNLMKDMRDDAVEIIINYIILYKDYNNTETLNSDRQVESSSLITSEPITLTYFRTQVDDTNDLEEISTVEFYKELEKRTNVTISFIDVLEEVRLQKLVLMAAAGDTPDLIEFPWQRHMGLLENMAEMEVIIELDGLINKSAPNLHSILQSNWEVKRQITSDNGHIYQIPGINLSDNRVTTGPVIRGDLLKKYGLNEPETIEDWERMLTAFKDRDATINPLSFDMSIFKESNSFISAFGIPYGFGVRDGKVFYAPIEDSYKEFLITFSRWYKEGLLDPEFILLRNSQLNDRVNSGKVGAFIGSVNNLRDSIDALKSIDPSFELIPVQNPVLQNVDALNIKSGIPTVTEFGIAIGSRNKYAEESMKWIDYAYSEEGYRLYNYGIEGYTYTVDNDQIQYTDINLNNTDSLSVNQAMDRYLRALPVVPGYRTDESIGKSYTYKEQKEAVGLWSANSGEYNPSLMPPVSLTQEESYELSTIMDNLSVYKEEMFAKYVIGAASLDLFDEYVETTKKIGIDQAIEIMQTALDRYNNRLPKLKVNGKIIETDTEPVVITKGETLLPIRFVIEGLGGSVAWHDKSKIVTGVLKDTVVTLKISSAEVLVDYEPKMLDTEIMAMNQRTYVPAIFIQEVLGVTINYDENSRTVTITSY